MKLWFEFLMKNKFVLHLNWSFKKSRNNAIGISGLFLGPHQICWHIISLLVMIWHNLHLPIFYHKWCIYSLSSTSNNLIFYNVRRLKSQVYTLSFYVGVLRPISFNIQYVLLYRDNRNYDNFRFEFDPLRCVIGINAIGISIVFSYFSTSTTYNKS